MAKITLEKYGENGWEFTVDAQSYRTNKEGEGLWEYQKSGVTSVDYVDGERKYSPVYEYKQTVGTCDFSLPRDEKRARRKIYYEFVTKPQNEEIYHLIH